MAQIDPETGLVVPGTRTPYLPVSTPASTTATITAPAATTPTQPTGYTKELLGDPIGQAAYASFNANTQRGRNRLRDSIRQLVIASGLDPTTHMDELAEYAKTIDPTLGAEFKNYLTPDVLQQAAANPFSSMRTLKGALAGGQINLRNALAARGIIGSGAEATGGTSLLRHYDVGVNTALQKALSDIRTGIGGYGDTLAGEEEKLNTALNSVAARLAASPGPTYSTVPAAKQTATQVAAGVPGVTAAQAKNPATAAYIARSKGWANAYKRFPRLAHGGI